MTSTRSSDLTERIRPLKRIEYDRLVEAGLLANEKVELIRGLIVHMSPQGSSHAAAVQSLTRLLVLATGPSGRAEIRVQLPLALGDDSEPEPDLAVVPPGSYRQAHPTSAFIVIEVADTSLAQDRRVKGALYAGANIPEYWIVDTAHERVEVHSEILDGAYGRVTPHRRGDTVSSTALPGLQVAVDDVFA